MLIAVVDALVRIAKAIEAHTQFEREQHEAWRAHAMQTDEYNKRVMEYQAYARDFIAEVQSKAKTP